MEGGEAVVTLMRTTLLMVFMTTWACVTTQAVPPDPEPVANDTERLSGRVDQLDKKRARNQAKLETFVSLGAGLSGAAFPDGNGGAHSLNLQIVTGLGQHVMEDQALWALLIEPGWSLRGGGPSLRGLSIFAWRLGMHRVYLGPHLEVEGELGSSLNNLYRWRSGGGLGLYMEPDGDIRFPGSVRIGIQLGGGVGQAALDPELHGGVYGHVFVTYDIIGRSRDSLVRD